MKLSHKDGKKVIVISKSEWIAIGKQYRWSKSKENFVKTAQNLDTVKTPEKFTEREVTRAIRDAIIAEEGAIKQYETVVDATDNVLVKEVLTSVANEERVHVGELQTLLNMLLGEEKGFLEDGRKEVEDKK